MMNSGKHRGSRTGDLVRLLDGLRDLHERLLRVIGEKIDALRTADLAAMQALSQKEHALVERIQEREGLRQQLMDAMAGELGLSGRGRALTLSSVASSLAADESRSLKSAGEQLRAVVFKVSQANRVAGLTSRTLDHHLAWVFSAVRPQRSPGAAYGSTGRPVAAGDAKLFEAVG